MKRQGFVTSIKELREIIDEKLIELMKPRCGLTLEGALKHEFRIDIVNEKKIYEKDYASDGWRFERS